MAVPALTNAETLPILYGPRMIDPRVTSRVSQALAYKQALANPERLNHAMRIILTPVHDRGLVAAQNYKGVVTLASASHAMASQMAGDVSIPRPRRLYEHTQSVLNIYRWLFSDFFADDRDRFLAVVFLLQDIGKAHCVAVHASSCDQARYNRTVARNLLASVSDSILSAEEKHMVSLLVRQTGIGMSLKMHLEKGRTLDEATHEAKIELSQLRRLCPLAYADRFDDYLIVSFLADAGAHTQRAHFIDAESGKLVPDVTWSDRYDANGADKYETLDRIFSEEPADAKVLRLFEPKHLAVMDVLFPDSKSELLK